MYAHRERVDRLEVSDLRREVLPDGLEDARIQEFRVQRRIEVPVVVDRPICDLNVVTLSLLPFDEGQESLGIGLEHLSIVRDSIQGDTADGEDDSGRSQAPDGQYMVQQPAMESPVAVLQRVDVHQLGAYRDDIVKLVLAKGMKQIGVGMAVGLVFGAALARPLQLVAFRVDPNDPTVYAAVIVTLTLTGLLACLVPAVRAARVDVVQAVKAE